MNVTHGYLDDKKVFPRGDDAIILGSKKGVRYNDALTILEREHESRIDLYGPAIEAIATIAVAVKGVNDPVVHNDYDEIKILGWIPVSDEDYALVREFVLTWLHKEALKSNALFDNATA